MLAFSPRVFTLGRMDISTLLDQLPESRRAHSIAVGERVRRALTHAPHSIAPEHHEHVVTAALLHDVGYAPSLAHGFHPLDGALGLQVLGFDPIVCDLVAHHTGAEWEAEERGIPADALAFYACDVDGIEEMRALVSWADLRTSPTGEAIEVEERLDDIVSRYGADHPVGRSVTAHRLALLALGSRFDPPHPYVHDERDDYVEAPR